MRNIILFCLLFFASTPTFALARFADRMEEVTMNMTAITVILIITQILYILFIRFSKHKLLWAYNKRKILQITNWISRKRRLYG